MNQSDLPLRKTMCGSCPFRPGSEYAYLVDHLTASAVAEASRICHSTGGPSALKPNKHKSHLCRGARDVQLRVFCSLGVISEPTDEAWNEERVNIGLAPTVVTDPKGK